MTASSAPAASTRTSRAACGSRFCASSTSSSRILARSAASRSGSAAKASSAAPTSSAAPKRGHRGLRRRHADRGAQQHHLLVDLRELARGHPLRTTGPAADALQLSGFHPTFGAAGQAGRAARWRTRRCRARAAGARPGHRGVVAVLEVTREQLADDAVLLGAGDQPRRRITVALGRQPQHRERVGVHGAHHRFPHRRRAAVTEQPRRDRRRGRCAPSRAEPVSSRTDSGSTPAATCAAAASTSSDVFPVPGPPTRARCHADRARSARSGDRCGAWCGHG